VGRGMTGGVCMAVRERGGNGVGLVRGRDGPVAPRSGPSGY
jgi:hypothetical protein